MAGIAWCDMGMTGAEIIIKKLQENKVDIVFEFPGGSICPILDELYRTKSIRTICFRHEQGAIHAADAYARINRRPGVCMATSGPGASNLVTGIANAFLDSVPLVIITGQVAVWDLKTKAGVRQKGFQELDIVSIVKPITKASFLVNKVSDLSKILDKAFYIAQNGRPGPVLVDIPINVQYTASNSSCKKLKIKKNNLNCSSALVKRIADKLCNSKNPLVVIGGGVIISGATGEANSLIRKFKLPVAETLMGLAVIPHSYPLNLGLVGYAGSRLSREIIKEADFILGLGLRFDNRAFPGAAKDLSPSAFIVQVDCDKSEFNHRVAVNQVVFSDVKDFLIKLNLHLNKAGYKSNQAWANKIADVKRDAVVVLPNRLSPQVIMEELSAILKNKDSVITTDVGQHQLWVAQYFKFNGRQSLITSGGLGTMGFGLPAAIGAQFAKKNAAILNITSDGSMQMNIQELATIKDCGLPVKILLLNNKCLGLVRQIQEFAFSKRFSSTRTNSNVDFCKIAHAYGIAGFQINRYSQLKSALKKLIESKESMLLEVDIDEFENVYPVCIKGKVIYADTKS